MTSEVVPDEVNPTKYRDMLQRGGEVAEGKSCPRCGGIMGQADPEVVGEDTAYLTEAICLRCSTPLWEPASCSKCGETTTEFSLRYSPTATFNVEPICLDCTDSEKLPQGMPLGGRRVCGDCLRGERDGVKARVRRTWGIYPQDRYRTNGFPRYCDDCWQWRKEQAPLKPTREEIEARWREVKVDD